MAVRKIQYAPTKQGRQPSTNVRKVRLWKKDLGFLFITLKLLQDFMFCEGEMELEAALDRQLYHHGDEVRFLFNFFLFLFLFLFTR